MVLEIKFPTIGIKPKIKVKITSVLAKGRCTPNMGNRICENTKNNAVLMSEILNCAKTTFLNDVERFSIRRIIARLKSGCSGRLCKRFSDTKIPIIAPIKRVARL